MDPKKKKFDGISRSGFRQLLVLGCFLFNVNFLLSSNFLCNNIYINIYLYSFQEVNRSIPMHERNLTNELIVKIRIPQPFTLENRTYMPDFISSIKKYKKCICLYLYVCMCVCVGNSFFQVLTHFHYSVFSLRNRHENRSISDVRKRY